MGNEQEVGKQEQDFNSTNFEASEKKILSSKEAMEKYSILKEFGNCGCKTPPKSNFRFKGEGEKK